MKCPAAWGKKALCKTGIMLFAVATGIAALWYLAVFLPPPPLLDGVPFGRMALDARGNILKLALADDDKYRFRISLDQIPAPAREALLQYEDKYFYLHPGINLPALLRGAMQTALGGRKAGASTISMQVVRLRFGLSTSTPLGKLKQIFYALLLERHYSKPEILCAYFNLAPYGGNIEGIEAAARIYFGKPARALTPLECVALTVIPQNPVGRQPVSGPDFNEARARLAQMLALKEGARPLAVRSPAQLPFLSPHLSMELLGGKQYLNGSGIAQSYIASDLQALLERAIDNLVLRGRKFGLENAAAILVNTDNMQVQALAGSADYHNAAIAGQVDGTRAKRSPGSTLKPFIYALALEEGLIHPRSILNDSPKSFGGYDPENFDKGFRGPLSATEALLASRNLPAILLAEQLAAPGLYGFLKSAHVRLPYEAGHYGLALALGGVETTMRELAALYAMLANQGIWSGLRFAEGEPAIEQRRLLSPESAHTVLRMLERDDLFARQKGRKFLLRCKTGTSNGFRDAWTAGLVGQYALVVWVGNFDNRANPAFTGVEAALPLFCEIAAGLGGLRELRDDLPQREKKLNLRRLAVCKSTGDLDVSRCAEHVETLFIPGVSPTRDSGILRSVLIDRKTGLRACKPGDTEEVYWEFWPTEQRKIFAAAGHEKPLPPPWLPECQKSASLYVKPQIILPKKNAAYLNGFYGIPLKASLDAEAGFAHWFAGKVHLGKSAAGETLLWQPEKPGEYEIVVVDDLGGSSRQKCVVLGPNKPQNQSAHCK